MLDDLYRRVASVPDLMMAWGQAWTVSRGTPAPVPIVGGFRVEVGAPGHRVRHVLHTYTLDSLARLGRELTTPGTWIKVSGDPAGFRAALPASWTMDAPGHLMTTTLAVTRAETPAPYTARLTADGEVTIATVLGEQGKRAAAGRLACAGGFAIMDQVVTEPAHRRRGLGRAVMTLLAARAIELDAHTGILVASDAGRALYTTLGWTVRSDIAGAYIAEN
ncbi:GNAT family N-acetyltransferase [Micromonospora sp. BQ11]|uniref:GNAT family N-acetyltransferase n=1 Tax=Micromonospora sp. BQ11 TaxID=3452212 RepID=UPI003F8B01C9